MAVVTQARRASASAAISLRAWALPLAVLGVLALCVPMFATGPSNLTSDESLYLAEAYNIAEGHGLTYPSGEPITHRAPLYALVLAPFVKLGGPDAAYTAAKLIVAFNALLVLAVAWRMAGAVAGTVAGATAAASAYLGVLGTTLFLDPLLCTFLLLTVAALWQSTRGDPVRWCACAGLAAGCAFLVKESAVQWAPIALVAWLAVPQLRTRAGLLGSGVFMLAFGAAVAPWYAWVYAHTSEMYLVGDAGIRSVVLVVAAAALPAVCLALALRPLAVPPAVRRMAVPAAAVIAIAWGGAMIVALTAHATWPYPNDYVTSVPRYVVQVAPAAQPFLLFALAWGWAIYAASRREPAPRLLLLAAALYAPFAIFAANRWLELRDALPLIYLSHVVLGLAVADGVRRLRTAAEPSAAPLVMAALAVAGVAFAVQQHLVFRDDHRAVSAGGVRYDSWDNELTTDAAAWMGQHIPPGSRLLVNRLYFSSLHVETEARYEIRQLPTVRVGIDPAGERLLTPASNLFRWGDGDLRAGDAGDRWLYLREFPGKGYVAGMTQQELLEYLAAHQSDYVVLTGDDLAFSTLALADYLAAHPAFALVHHHRYSERDQTWIFAVDRTKLVPIAHPVAISPSTHASLLRRTSMSASELERAIGTPVRVTDLNYGISAREEAIALERWREGR